ncbi:hypothetical protein V9T40_005947 [Parthenolecanium corni]|uniref:Uncharacterized protein n=1 Tax=Parthenolecanium corni TaxID=536013 RepID=A0AAN9YA26_9HEMI
MMTSSSNPLLKSTNATSSAKLSKNTAPKSEASKRTKKQNLVTKRTRYPVNHQRTNLLLFPNTHDDLPHYTLCCSSSSCSTTELAGRHRFVGQLEDYHR